uniref:RING finger protein 228-like n=1 Tax=Centroberyx gerrardi TaxID=166262 RepID=UPI003AAE648D
MAEEAVSASDCGSVPPEITVSSPGEEYECKICYNYFDLERHTPKILGCLHTFCQECLDSLHLRDGRGWRIGCPLCRHRTPVPEYQVHNLPDNTAVTDALPLDIKQARHLDELVNGGNTDGQAGAAVSPAASQDSNESCHTCKQVAVTAACVCAIFSFLSMVVLLFLGLIFVHNFNDTALSVGPICLSVASVLALLSLILTWLVCLVKYRPESETGHFSSTSSNVSRGNVM